MIPKELVLINIHCGNNNYIIHYYATSFIDLYSITQSNINNVIILKSIQPWDMPIPLVPTPPNNKFFFPH
jgi:hypothetical protein